MAVFSRFHASRERYISCNAWSENHRVVPGRNGQGRRESVSQEILLLGFCCLLGFATAGVATSFYKLVTSQPARFALLGPSWWATFSSFLYFAVSGPAIVTNAALGAPLFGTNRLGWMTMGFAVALVWSVCWGIFLLELVISVQSSFV